MLTVKYSPVYVCQDCIMAHAGYTPDELSYTPEREPLALLDGYEYAPDYDAETGEGVRESHWDCGGCGDPLAGTRYRLAVWREALSDSSTGYFPPTPGRLHYLNPGAVTRVHADEHAPRSTSASGYGRKIPTRYRITLTDNRTRRVYAACFGNAASLYILVAGECVGLDVKTEHALIELP